ncbi:NAD-dependent dihydropyrimidine dehydrogenase PreA subunit [Desulfosalsimonas propionicica]|uniref:NAD-dependent dihydropyrimidine dehydrogenase PreA subunit n=1 Tax=Desulfosalsimonas propionicica TaxID=332175 RepID=A0A7W0C8B4_9BACT|nr:mercury methylation ferredoxin HgcB [Desulfosalsimonas propionicica]MBA2881039.1 NAD-dependent dihydropyrimidine dehydrogenase PreA subunit [Desulfosalsimonas propionicica]
MGTTSFTYLKNVTTLELNPELCTGCGMCTMVCPREVMALADGKAEIVSRDDCMECGACAQNCPTAAITVDAGVGCAAAVINSMLGRTGDSCCCVVEPDGKSRPECGPGCC